jgi:transcriptional regulator with XRE-family HTH domain
MSASTLTQRSGSSVRFSIAKVAEFLDVSTATLRKWERLGIVRPKRGANGYREFSPAEVHRLKAVQKLKTEKNVSSAAVAHLLKKDEGETRNPNGGARVGPRLKRLREQAGSTLSEAAEKAGISVSYLSCIEREHSNPSVAVLQKLAALYGTNVLSFFGEALPAQKLVHPKERRRLTTGPGVTIELLALGQCTMEPHLFRVSPGASSGGAYSHEGEEFIFMLKGSFDIWLDEVEHYHLTSGDSLYFSSRQSHRWMNSGEEDAEMIWSGSVVF